MKSIIMSISFLLLPLLGYTQAPETDKKAQAEVSKLHFLTGNWKGQGWMMGRDGKKHTFVQTEKVQFKIDSVALLVEGLGKSEGKTIHNALALITYNKDDGNYKFQSNLASGHGGNFKAEIKDGKFYWYPNENMRYIIQINDKGQWHEIGEMKRDQNWTQFFEMTLDKVST